MPLDSQFQRQLAELVNKHSVDAQLNIPDYKVASEVCKALRSLADNPSYDMAVIHFPDERATHTNL